MKKGISIAAVTLLVLSFSVFCLGQKKIALEQENGNQMTTKYGVTKAFTEGQGVYIRWQMEVENKNLGFNVFKYEGFRKVQVNPGLIGGGYFRNGVETSFGFDYAFFDPTGNFRTSYVIESFDFEGKSVVSDYIYPIFVKDLKPIAGTSNEAMLKAASKDNSLAKEVEPVLPSELAIEITQNSLPPDLNKQKFIASQPGVKIGVDKEGIYRVTRTELENAGFDISQPSENWQLYVNGVEQGILIGENDAFIEFYGKGVNTNETGIQTYFLINGAENGKRVGNAVRRRIRADLDSKSFRTSTFRKDSNIYFPQVRNGEATNFFSNKIINSTGTTVDFDLNDVDFTHSKMRIIIKIQGVTFTPHQVEVTLNGQYLGNISGINRTSMSMDILVPPELLIDGTNSLFFKTAEGATGVSIWDSLEIFHKRFYKARQNALSFFTNPYRSSTVKGFTSPNIRVFDITYPDHPSLITNLQIQEDNGNFGVHLPGNRSKRFYAVEDSSVLQAVSIAPNKPSNISATNLNGEFIVISYKDWLTEANDWANYRAGEGFSTQVIDVEDIFDEFNYGRISANSIRDFLNFAKNNWATPPDYVLLLGDTSYDPRDYENRGNINYMPAQMVDTLYEETGSDEAMADFDNDGLAELAIGRIPVKDAATVSNVLSKIMSFELSVANGLDRGALFPSDFPNGYDFKGLNQRLANELPAEVPKVVVNRADPNARATLLNELDSGKYIVNYAGHGAISFWSANAFFGVTDVQNIQNQNNLSIFSMLTCLNGYFLTTFGNSLAEVLLHTPDIGGVAAWSSTGLTTPDIQEVMGKKYFQNFSDPSIERMGDSIRSAKATLVGGRDVRLSWALMGDPLLKIK